MDLLITDQIMPQMSGGVLSAEARLTRPGLPIPLATGYAQVHPGRAPATPRLAKPFTLDDLRQAIIETMA